MENFRQLEVETALTKDSEFMVGEDRVLDSIMAFLFFAIFIYGLVDAFLLPFPKINYTSFIFFVALLPAVIYFKKAKNKKVYIRINKRGIYQDEILVTDWSNFLNAYIDEQKFVPRNQRKPSTQRRMFSRFQDNFILVLEYRKDSQSQGFRRKIPLTNTQNKSEEEIMAAVKFFFKENDHTF